MPLSPSTPPYDPHTPPRGRGLRREGAIANILSMPEQALVDAMMQSSSPLPESVLGRRTRAEDDVGDGDRDDPDGTPRASAQPSISNITAITLRYGSKKKLRQEQRDEVDIFLTVSPFVFHPRLRLTSRTARNQSLART